MSLPLLAELQRRRVIRALIGYGIAAFAVLQIIEPIMHGLHWPDAVLSYAVAALAIGFPIVVTLAWIFDVNAGRIERTPQAPAGGLEGARLTLVLLFIGVLAAAPGVVWYFFVRGASKPAAPVAAAEAPAPSIAVLPFLDMSPAKDQEYFSDGIAEEILNALAQVDGLHVTGRTSSFAFKGKQQDLREIGQKLGVTAVLEGSVRKAGNRVRVTAQVINVADGFHLLSRSYEKDLTDIFAVQDEIARAVVEALKVKLLPGKAPAESRPTNPQAYSLFLLGNQIWRETNDAGAALPVWEKAVSLDPAYAPAWGRIAAALHGGATPNETPTARANREQRALSTAEKAVALDPSSADALAARGLVRMEGFWDWEGARQDLERAFELAPSSAFVVRWYAHILRVLGRQDEALRTYRRAAELDPLQEATWRYLGWAYVNHAEYPAARTALKRAFDLALSLKGGSRAASHDEEWSLWGIAWSYLLEGQIDLAASWTKQISTDNEVLQLQLAAAMEHARGHRQEAKAALDALIDRSGSSDPLMIAVNYSWRGERDRAFEWLDRAYSAHLGLETIKLEASLKPLHGDPRWAAFLKKLHLPPD